MRMTKTMRSITLMYKAMHLNEGQVYHKSKMVLGVYRDVVWKTVQEVNFVREVCESYCSQNLNVALTYLEDFAPTEQKEKFVDRISCIFETSWIIELIDAALLKIYEYHTNGKLYHEILSKCYINSEVTSEQELLEQLSMERSTFYLRKKEAINLFGISLWGYALPKYKSLLIKSNCIDVDFSYYFKPALNQARI